MGEATWSLASDLHDREGCMSTVTVSWQPTGMSHSERKRQHGACPCDGVSPSLLRLRCQLALLRLNIEVPQWNGS